ncbi:ATP:cob(I)alamin adenosyltransferase [Spirochaetia bacterium]|nr:ATP:cob(I)alamin adenosyltransferase [Spirochaetia bacterium]
MNISTKTGDNGTSALPDGRRLPKDHPRFEVLGTLDELNAFLGDARIIAKKENAEIIFHVQKSIIKLSGYIASSAAANMDVEQLEKWITERDNPPKNFVIPGSNNIQVKLHIARTVCRRAERCLAGLHRLEKVDESFLIYMNRLSDLLFLLAQEEE